MTTPPAVPLLRRLLRGLRVVLANLIVLIALLLFTNLVSALALSEITTLRSIAGVFGLARQPPNSAYAKLPVYPDEATARLIWREFDESRSVEFVPFVEWKRKPFAGRTVHVDADGDRFWPEATVLPAGAPVVRLFGGSAMWGSGVADLDTIPAALARLRPRYRVLNHGESEYNSRQNLERLVNLLGRGERVDVAVFYEGFNDVLTLCRRDVSLNGQGEEPRIRWLLKHSSTLRYFLIGKTQELLTDVFSHRRSSYGCADDPARARAVATTVFNQWKLARTLVEAQGGRLIVVLEPVAMLGRPQLDYFADRRTPNEPSSAPSLSRQIRIVYPYWQALSREPGNAWIHDFTGAFDGDRRLYLDMVHADAEGNALIARRVAPLVDEGLQGRPQARQGTG